jgi:hypothetical protein
MPGLDPGIHRKCKWPGESPAISIGTLDFSSAARNCVLLLVEYQNRANRLRSIPDEWDLARRDEHVFLKQETSGGNKLLEMRGKSVVVSSDRQISR